MDLGLKGKKVILTGGSRGIGRASLEIFAEEGCDIAFFSRNPDQVAETVESLSRHGGKVIGEAFDMSDLDAYKNWLTSAADKLGRMRHLRAGGKRVGRRRDWRLGRLLQLGRQGNRTRL